MKIFKSRRQQSDINDLINVSMNTLLMIFSYLQENDGYNDLKKENINV